jgi:hypothetical protein
MTRVVRSGLHWTAIPNGGKRDLRVAVKLKREGVRRGTPDIIILLPEGRVAWLELKIKGGSLSPDQRAFRDVCAALGHHWGMAKTLEEVTVFLRSIGALKQITQANLTEGESKWNED